MYRPTTFTNTHSFQGSLHATLYHTIQHLPLPVWQSWRCILVYNLFLDYLIELLKAIFTQNMIQQFLFRRLFSKMTTRNCSFATVVFSRTKTQTSVFTFKLKYSFYFLNYIKIAMQNDNNDLQCQVDLHLVLTCNFSFHSSNNVTLHLYTAEQALFPTWRAAEWGIFLQDGIWRGTDLLSGLLSFTQTQTSPDLSWRLVAMLGDARRAWGNIVLSRALLLCCMHSCTLLFKHGFQKFLNTPI